MKNSQIAFRSCTVVNPTCLPLTEQAARSFPLISSILIFKCAKTSAFRQKL